MSMITKIKQNNGVALIVTILLMTLVLYLSLYFLNFSLTEERIARSQSLGAKTYYLAEAGIAEMVWKLKNDAVYENNFKTNPSWTETLTRNDPFGSNSGSYSVTITNSALARGEIIATGSYNIGDNTSQRTVKAAIYKAIGAISIEENAGYANGNIDISTSNVNFYNGGAHSNNIFNVNGETEMFVEGDLSAVNNYNENWKASTTITGITNAPGADYIDMPAVDFNSADPNSYINIADIVYDEDGFEDLMEANPNLVLNDLITYVNGNVDLEDLQSLTINGLLVIKGLLDIEDNLTFITVNHTEGNPSGIICYDDIDIDGYSGNLDINGIIYSGDKIDITDIPDSASTININGAIVSRKLTITNVKEPFNITYDNEIITTSLRDTEFSPLIIFDHWEEEY